MSKFSRKFGKWENTLFYADYGAHFFIWLIVTAMIVGIIYIEVFL